MVAGTGTTTAGYKLSPVRLRDVAVDTVKFHVINSDIPIKGRYPSDLLWQGRAWRRGVLRRSYHSRNSHTHGND